MLIITRTYVKPLEEIDALMPKHVAWLKRQYTAGLFIASGRQKPRVGGRHSGHIRKTGDA